MTVPDALDLAWMAAALAGYLAFGAGVGGWAVKFAKDGPEAERPSKGAARWLMGSYVLLWPFHVLTIFGLEAGARMYPYNDRHERPRRGAPPEPTDAMRSRTGPPPSNS